MNCFTHDSSVAIEETDPPEPKVPYCLPGQKVEDPDLLPVKFKMYLFSQIYLTLPCVHPEYLSCEKSSMVTGKRGAKEMDESSTSFVCPNPLVVCALFGRILQVYRFMAPLAAFPLPINLV